MTSDTPARWKQFLDFIKQRVSASEFHNWLEPIRLLKEDEACITLEVPNVFVQEYLIDNYKQDLADFLPVDTKGIPSINFEIAKRTQELPSISGEKSSPSKRKALQKVSDLKLNKLYTFSNFIEGPSNQFVKSAAFGVAAHPGRSYNPLFIYGGVGLGKTHLLHSIGHHIVTKHKKLRVQSITTEGFINDLVDHLKSKSIDKMKRFYRNLDVLLVDDIQFLQNRLNFEEEFCNTFEALIHQHKQIVITSDKPPSSLKLSERLIARMEWGLVANVGSPDLETRVAILQHKAKQKGIDLKGKVAFYIAEHIYNNVRQLEGAINRLSAHCRLLQQEATEEVASETLSELFEAPQKNSVTIDGILSTVATMYDVKVSDLKGTSRVKTVAFPRQVAMYLAKEMMSDSLVKVASSFGGKTHSTVIHAWKKVAKQAESDPELKQKLQKTKKTLEGSKT